MLYINEYEVHIQKFYEHVLQIADECMHAINTEEAKEKLHHLLTAYREYIKLHENLAKKKRYRRK